MTNPAMTCDDFQAQLSDYLDEHALTASRRAAAEAHLATCVECTGLVLDLRDLVRNAAELEVLSPSRDLWSGIESRIEAPVVALPTRTVFADAPIEAPVVTPASVPVVALPWRRMAVAASLLVAASAAVTYSIVKPGAPTVATPTAESPAAIAPQAAAVDQVSLQATEQTFDREIGAMRRVIDERRKELDPATVAVLEKNLKLIDAAISESKAALAKDPASEFLMDRLTHAYDTKLQLLRGVAAIPSHS